jgi:iron complex transport system ATP-binding protein
MTLTIKDLSFDYRSHEVLENISFTVQDHEIVAVMGPNGAGKSTLLKCINRILRPKMGTVLVGEEDIRHLSQRAIARKVGYVAQRNETSRLTVFDAILLGRHPHIRSTLNKRDLLVTSAIVDKLHLNDLSLRYIDQISGGELQKVCIARALVQEPELLLLDEPTTSLDLKNQVEIMKLIRTIVSGHHVSVVMSLHDINMAIHYADTIIFLKDKQIYALCTKSGITAGMIRQVYGIDVTLHDAGDYPIVIPALY